MGSVRVWVLIFITTSVSKGELVALKGYDLVYKLENSDVPRALLVNDLGNLVQSVATDAFTTCLFVKLDNYNGLTEVYLFSFSSQENHKVDEIVLRLDCVRHLLILYVHGLGYSSSVPTALDEWTHICVSWESNGGIVNMHVNAVRVGNGGLVHPGYILGGQGYFILGQYQDSFNGSSHPDTGVHGKITQFNLWNRVLTTDEVKEVQTCKLEGNVVSWSDSYWSLKGSLYKQKSDHQCGTLILQECECVKPEIENFENLLQTYKAELQDGLNKMAQTISDIEKTNEIAQQAIAELTQRLESKENDITSLKNAILILEQRSTKNELEICYQKQAIDECKKRECSLDQNLKSEMSNQKQAIDAFGQRVSSLEENLRSLEQSLKSDISSLTATINATLQSCITQAPGVAQPRTFCPPAFTIIHGRCYYFSQEIKNNWDEASRLCQELDPRGVLANIETAQEWEFLKTYLIEKELTSKNWWLGGSDRDDEGHWTWRGTNQPFAYDAWCLGQPDNARGNENCLHVMNATFPLCWNDIHCTHNPFGYHLNFICEI